jgi:hypothetical protein
MLTTRHRLPAIIAVATLALVLVASTAPASAASSAARSGQEITHGHDVARTDSSRLWGLVCDFEHDGNAVYGVWDLLPPYRHVREADGGDPGCDATPAFRDYAMAFKLCERRPGPDPCTRWHRT